MMKPHSQVPKIWAIPHRKLLIHDESTLSIYENLLNLNPIFQQFAEMSRVRKKCQICGEAETKKRPVVQGTATGNRNVAKNMLSQYSVLELNCIANPHEFGWSGKPDDHLSISDHLTKIGAGFHAACRKRFTDLETERILKKRAATNAPIVAGSSILIEGGATIQGPPIINDPNLSVSLEQPAASAEMSVASSHELESERGLRSYDTQTASTLSESTIGSVWTPGKRKCDNQQSDLMNTPKRIHTSLRKNLMNLLLERMKEEGHVYSVTDLFHLYNGIVSDNSPDIDRTDQTFVDEKLFLSSVKTYIGSHITIEHDGWYRETMICHNNSLFKVMKRIFDQRKSSDFSRTHPGLVKVREAVVSCSSGGKFEGSFTEDMVYRDNAAPKELQNAISYLCYGVPDVKSFDILSISNSIYYNHRKRPDIVSLLHVLSFIKLYRWLR